MDVKDSLASFSPSSSSSSVRVTMKKACMEGDVQMVSKLIRAIHWELDEVRRREGERKRERGREGERERGREGERERGREGERV